MDNVRIVREKLDNKDVSDIRLQEGTDAKQLTDVEISKSETEGNLNFEILELNLTEKTKPRNKHKVYIHVNKKNKHNFK